MNTINLTNVGACDLIIPEKVERKIRMLCCAINNIEWSGVLYYRPIGNIMDDNFKIECVDLYVMDVGDSASTEFNNSVDPASYMVAHPELLEEDVQEGLIHSHHTMSAFFSGTDSDTLHKEGMIRNHFLSLIVNNAGNYVARFTRRLENEIHETINRTKTSNSYYKSFNNAVINVQNSESSNDTEVKDYTTKKVEFYECNIIKESSMDEDIIELSNRITSLKGKVSPKSYYQYYQPVKTTNIQEQSLFKYESAQNTEYNLSIDVVKMLAAQLLTGSITVNPKNLDLAKWIQSIDSIYIKRFGNFMLANDKGLDSAERLETWLETFIDFIIFEPDEKLLDDLNKDIEDVSMKFDTSDTSVLCAEDLHKYISTFNSKSTVIDKILNILESYLNHN